MEQLTKILNMPEIQTITQDKIADCLKSAVKSSRHESALQTGVSLQDWSGIFLLPLLI